MILSAFLNTLSWKTFKYIRVIPYGRYTNVDKHLESTLKPAEQELRVDRVRVSIIINTW